MRLYEYEARIREREAEIDRAARLYHRLHPGAEAECRPDAEAPDGRLRGLLRARPWRPKARRAAGI